MGAVSRAKPTTKHWVLGLLVFVALAAWPVAKFLFLFPQDQWQVDVQVYREGGLSILQGRDIYAQMTQPPQLLPFTYPPFAALLFAPLQWIPLTAAAVVVTVLSVLALWVCITLVLRSLNSQEWAAWGLCAAMLTEPITQTFSFGQINILLTALVVIDLLWVKKARGILTGIAMLIANRRIAASLRRR